MKAVHPGLPYLIRLLIVLGLWQNVIVAQSPPLLQVSRPAANTARLAWEDPLGTFSLENSSVLPAAQWEVFPGSPVAQGSMRSIDIPIGNATRFFRLRAGTPPQVLTRIASTSPDPGETAVSVNRETVFELTTPLSTNVVITTNQIYAVAGGRRILARVEISAARDLVSLFYMENLPSGARVDVTFDGNGLADSRGLQLDLDADGFPGGEAKVTFETVNTTVIAATAVIGRVLASEPGPNGQEVPLANVTITVDGLEESVRTTTAADGTFRLEPSPVGKFFVNVDGRTAVGSQWPNGAYYPVLGKAWEAVAGKTNNLAGGTGIIYLPLVAAGTLQAVSATIDTTVTFPQAVLNQKPELQGVEIVVPPNGLFSDSGARGGSVGLAPVASDRLPEPLPAGLNHALDISIQTSGGQNFTEPVPAKFPNLPDPVTGQKLPPGAKTALWSFNHDTGRWEMQGPMTVTEDGNFVVTDPGVGIRQPGWHGTSPGSSGGGGPGNPPPCSPGGLLEPGTSSCSDDPPCPDEPSDAKKKYDECLATAGECAMKCYEKCGSGGPIRKILGALKKAWKCKQAADCSIKCKQDGEKCRDKWQPCFMGGGLGGLSLAVERAGALRAQATIDAVMMDALRIQQEQDQHNALWLALGPYIEKADTFEQLSPADQAAVNSLVDQLDALYGGKAPEEYYNERHRRFVQLVLQSPLADTLFPPVSGYYVLEDLQTGLIRRGRTEPRGYLNGIILRPNAEYRIRLLLGRTLVFHDAEFTSAEAGRNTIIPYGEPLIPASIDLDADGIPASAEFVLGTRDDRADSDQDGVSDLQELKNGTDPLDGAPAVNGVIAGLDTPGNAADIAIEGNTAVVADGAAGVAILDVTNPLKPALLARWETPGSAQGVALSLPGVAVADGNGGLLLLDLSLPASPVAVRTIATGSEARAVAVSENTAFCGLANGTIVTADLVSGAEIQRISLPGGSKIEDLAIQGEYLYAWAEGSLHVISLAFGEMVYLRSVSGQVGGGQLNRRMRLNLNTDKAYAAYPAGIVIFGLQDGASPVMLQRRATTQNGFKHPVVVMPDLAIVADGLNLVDEEPQDVSLYDLGATGTELNFLANFRTPGMSGAIALHRGYAFVADGPAGVQVVNFVPTDTAGVAPTIQLTADFSLNPAQIESGQRGRLTAIANDDVMVREVEFYLNGAIMTTDGGWPFTFDLTAGSLTTSNQNFRVRARAIDTAGNATWSEEYVVQLLPDQTPPRVLIASPNEGAVIDGTDRVLARFSEPLDFASISSGNVRLLSAGNDLVFGTGDDAIVQGIASYFAEATAAMFEVVSLLGPGRYRFTVQDVRDLAGNTQATPFSAAFWVAAGGPNGDADGDGLLNSEEGAAQTSPFNEDSDGDGWADEVEVHDKKNPNDAASKPTMTIVLGVPTRVMIEDVNETLPNGPGPFVAQPPVEVLISSADEVVPAGPWVAQPDVLVEIGMEDGTPGPWVARPPIETQIESSQESVPAGPFVAQPPVIINRSN